VILAEIMLEDLFKREEFLAPQIGNIKLGGSREYCKLLYAQMLGRGNRKTLSLGGVQEGNAQVFQLSGKVVEGDGKRLRVSPPVYMYTRYCVDIP
jgi:hypothetical protein